MLAERLAEISQRIQSAGGRGIRIVVATKSRDIDTLIPLAELGMTDFGESYVEELLKKQTDSQAPANINWHFIGTLQSNKVRLLEGQKISLFQSVDRPSLIQKLGKHFPGNDVLIQLDTTGQPNRSGASPEEISDLCELSTQNSLNPKGIMLIARKDKKECIEDFKLAHKIQQTLGLPILSAGMSNDFELAVGEGATMVRLGTALFD